MPHLINMLNKQLLNDKIRDLRVGLLSQMALLEDEIEDFESKGKSAQIQRNQLSDLEDFVKSFNALNFKLLE